MGVIVTLNSNSVHVHVFPQIRVMPILLQGGINVQFTALRFKAMNGGDVSVPRGKR